MSEPDATEAAPMQPDVEMDPATTAPPPEMAPALMSHVNMMMWMHNMYLSMMHRKFALEGRRATVRPGGAPPQGVSTTA